MKKMEICTTNRLSGTVIFRVVRVFAASLGLCLSQSGQATSGDIVIKAVAEVQSKGGPDGTEAIRLTPATRVVPGDEVIYTLEVRNSGTTSVRSPTVTYPVPAHMAFIADSATGPGAEVTYSVDGGITFGEPEMLRSTGDAGQMRPANASEYTHIRWKFKNPLKAKSVAFTRFRTVVK